MSTHILDEIFTYENQAQDIVNEAKKTRTELLNHAKATGERELSESLVVMRKYREQEIEKAQKESNEYIASFEKTLQEESSSDDIMRIKAKKVAHEMVSLVLKTNLGED